MDSEESILQAYVAWRPGTTNRVVVPDRTARLGIDSWAPLERFTNTSSELIYFPCRILPTDASVIASGGTGISLIDPSPQVTVRERWGGGGAAFLWLLVH
jgi:hypothetical protein